MFLDKSWKDTLKHSREGRRGPQGGCRSDWRSWSAWKVDSNHKQLHLVMLSEKESIKVGRRRLFFFLSTFECLHFVFNQAARHQKVTNFETKGISTVDAFQNIASQNSKTL